MSAFGSGGEAHPPHAAVRIWPSGVVLLTAVGVTLVALAPPFLAVLLCLTVAWCALPGLALARMVYAGHRGTAGAALLIGPVWGFALSSVVLLALWASGLRHWSLLVIAPLLATLIVQIAHGLRGVLTPPSFTPADLRAVLLLLCLVPLIVGRPYAQVGEDLPEGRAYRAYFTADFVWAMAVVAEVSKGEMPPRNQFLREEPLRYYWMPHLLSAVEYRHLADTTRLDTLLLVNGLAFGLVFVAFLYALTRRFVGSPACAALGSAAAITLTSFEGAERLVAIWREGLPLAHLRELNIDAVTRWFYGALPVDGLHRLLLYQPQHHGMAYATGFSALLVLSQARDPLRARVMALVGSLLGASVLMSAFAALLLTVIAAVYAIVLIVQHRAWRRVAPCALAASVPLAIAAGASLALQYVDPSASILELIVQEGALARAWAVIPLSLGPMLVTIAAGLVLAARRRDAALLLPAVVIAVSAFFYVFVNVRDHQDVYVAWRAGHFLFMAAAPLTALVLEHVWRAGRATRRAGLVLAVALALAAAPTVLIDLYNTQDLSNRRMGPGFPWTLVLSRDEVAALEWIRRETPPHAVVQVHPLPRDAETWAYIPAFAERRMAVGLPISMVPLRPYEVASRRMHLVYGAETAQEAFGVVARNFINFLVVGPVERTAYPQIEATLDAAPQLFPIVFRNADVSIYQPMPYERR